MEELSHTVPRGENAGRKLKHAPVVRALRKVADVPAAGWRGEVAFVAGPRLRAVLFVQEPRSGKIVGAVATPPGK